MSPGAGAPEQQARQQIDTYLVEAGWLIQNRDEMNLTAGRGVAVREFRLADGGFADYLLFVDGKAVGVLEAKPVGYSMSSIELQVDRYSTGLPEGLSPPVNPLPFLYMSTGVETRFINLLDPRPKTRPISGVPHIPWQNPFVESFNAVFRDECLDRWLLSSVNEAQEVADQWLWEYNEERPHGALNDSTPAAFAAMFREQGVAA